MSKAKFWSFKKAADGYELRIEGEIASQESWWFDDEVTPKKIGRQLGVCSGPLTVWINSPGGDAQAGAAIYTFLREYAQSAKVTVKISGEAASAASIIAMAGDEVLISPVGTIMLHDPWASIAGNSRVARHYADVLDEIAEGQLTAYMTKTGKSREQIRSWMEQETYFNAASAVEHGFADGILFAEGDDQAAVMASLTPWVYSRRAHSDRLCAMLERHAPEAPPPEATPTPAGDEADRHRLQLLALSAGNND